LVAFVFDESNNPSRKQVICSFAGHADRAGTTKAAAPSRSAIPSVSHAARRENANIRFIFSVLLRTFFAIPGPFFFWKEVKTNVCKPERRTPRSKRSHGHFRIFVRTEWSPWFGDAIRVYADSVLARAAELVAGRLV